VNALLVQPYSEITKIGWPRLAGRMSAWLAAAGRHGTACAVESARDRLIRRVGPGAARQRVTHMLTDLGPTFVKGAQLLSTRTDLLSQGWCATLGQLHDRVTPMTRAQAEVAIQGAYPARSRWPFADFEWIPAASGSIACVYRATLRDGRPVAVKVRRPRIREWMQADFALLSKGARAMQWVPGMRQVPAQRMVRQIGYAALRQLDLAAEAIALARLRDNLRTLRYFRVPEPLPEVSGDGVLVMEYIPGLGRFGPGTMTREQCRMVVRRVLQGVFQMLFLDGLVHCDMHPGNLYLTSDAEVVLLDAGFVVQLSPTVRRLFAEFFLNMSLGRGSECAEVMLSSAEHVPPHADLESFRADITELVEGVCRQTAGQFRLAPFATRLFDLQRRSGIAAAPEFIFPLLSLLVLEGMINEFDVDVDFQGEAIPTLLVALRT
jgi:ubiquinone biosynthesis protein